MKVHQDLHCRKITGKHLYRPDLSSPPEFQQVFKIVDTRGHGNAKDRHYLVYWKKEEAETRKLFDMDSKKFERPKLEIEYIAAEDPDRKTVLAKWKDYVIDGAFGKEDPGITCQAKNLVPPDLLSEFLDRNGDVSDSTPEHLSYRSTSTSFGSFSWEHASRLEESCHDLIEDFWTLHGRRIDTIRDVDLIY